MSSTSLIASKTKDSPILQFETLATDEINFSRKDKSIIPINSNNNPHHHRQSSDLYCHNFTNHKTIDMATKLSPRGSPLLSCIKILCTISTILNIISSTCQAQQQQLSNQPLLDKCCIIGKQKAIENPKFNCKLSASEAFNITSTIGDNLSPPLNYLIAGIGLDPMSTLGDQCEMILESCCMAHHRNKNCDSGKQFAKTGAGCMDVELSKEATLATESFNDCCMACSLGILAARTTTAAAATNQQQTTGLVSSNQLNSNNQNNNIHNNRQNKCKLISPLASSLSGQLYEKTYIECCQQALPRSAALIVPGATLNCSQANSCAQRCLEAGTYDPVTRKTLNQDQCACFSGYKLAQDEYNCMDIDECESGQHSCNKQSEVCDNTKGGYRCLARQIPRFSSQDDFQDSFRFCILGSEWDPVEKQCKPTAESGLRFEHFGSDPPKSRCTTGHHHCDSRSQRCLDNGLGGYNCVNRVSMIRREATEDSSSTSPSPDSSGTEPDDSSIDINKPKDPVGSVAPIGDGFDCPSDYRIDLNSKRCVKINICRPNPCKQGDTCLPFLNQNGEQGYKCQQQCPKGYRVISTSLDASLGFGNGVRNNVKSNTVCEDIDECRLGTNNCRLDDHEFCVNTDGAYVCRCETGFFKNKDGRCQDIDECAERGDILCPPDTSRCVNKPGSYQCECKQGFRHEGDNTKICVDVNECSEVEHTCQHTCLNTYGSRKCLCRSGYKLAEDGHNCLDIDECSLYQNQSSPANDRLCAGVCVNVPGSYQCSCPQGYRMSIDQTTCQDVNECVEDINRCGPDRVCFNTRGGFKCNSIICPDNYVKDFVARNKCKLATRSKNKNTPSSITYNYITFPADLELQPKGSAELFTMRGPKSFDIDAKFELKLLTANKTGEPNVRLAKRNDFSITEPEFNEAVINLVRPLQGPQDVELDLELKLYNNKVHQSTQLAKLIIYVTSKPF